MPGYLGLFSFPRRAVFFAAFSFLISAAVVCAQPNLSPPATSAPLTSTPPSLTSIQVVEEMMRHNQARADGLKHYQSIRHYEVEYKGYAAKIGAKLVVEADYDAV